MLSAFALSVLAQTTAPERTDLDTLRWTNRCGGEAANQLCVTVGRLTGNETLANLAPLLAPLLRIGLIVLLATAALLLIRRGVGRFVRRVKERGMAKIEASVPEERSDIAIARATMRAETIASVLRSFATIVILVLTLLMVLGELRINLGPLIAGAGIAGVAIGFGAQTLVRDFLTGIFMLIEDQYGLGDIIDTGEAAGTVEAISLRTTRLRDVNGVVWYVPNGEIRRVGNKSQEWSRAVLDIGVAYDTDIEHASAVIRRVADELAADPEWGPQLMDEPEVWGVEDFGDSEITIRLVLKTRPLQQWKVARAYRGLLKPAFDAEGIEIPFPQRTVWVRNDEPAELTPSKHKGNDADTAPA
jgi:moderate conductance mechanosensitive channel